MSLRRVVVDVGDRRTVETKHGQAELCEVSLRPDGDRAEPTSLTLWSDWSETADYLEPGMTVAAYDLRTEEFRGEVQFSTTGDSMVVVEPDFVVDVTDVRQWVQCPRMYYLTKLEGTPLAEPVVKGTIVHEVFGDLLRGRDLDSAVDAHVTEAGLELGLLGIDRDAITADVTQHARAIEGWLEQGTLTETDEWRSEQTLVSERYGIKGRADAVRRGMPVELKTGKNTRREPRFHDKVQAACYALVLGERRGEFPDTGTLLYTKNAAVDRSDESGDLSPAKEFSIGHGLLAFVLRARNELAAMEFDADVPTGNEADATCEYCFEQDTCMAISGRLAQESKAGQIGSPIPTSEREYFQRFYRAIEAQRRAVHAEFAKLWRQNPQERADADRALIDLEPRDRTQLDDGCWELRAGATGAVSKIREGDLVLASDGDPVGGEAELARVERLGEELVVTADEPVDLRRLDVYPSELFADRMLTALHDAVLSQSPAGKHVTFGHREPAFAPVEKTFVPNNDAQNAAVRLAVGAEDCALVHGPPGTGKTFTLAKTIRALVERGDRVLLSAFTNRAVDNALEALEAEGVRDEAAESGLDVVRVGTESGVRADMQQYRLQTSGDPAACAADLQMADVVAATTASCGSRVMREQSFDVAVVDEAGQLTEPATLAATALADRFVLVGDHQQLPPVVQADPAVLGPSTDSLSSRPTGEDGQNRDRSNRDRSNRDRSTLDGLPEDAAVADLSKSLFERLIEGYPDASVLLDRQYRMAQRIQAFPSREFYDGALRPASGAVASQQIGDLPDVDVSSLPEHLSKRVTFLDPDGSAQGHTNPAEAAAVADVVGAYLEAGVPPNDVGVIAPYRAQVATITEAVPDPVAVDTVDRFQGSSKEVIVVSFVATDTLGGPIFEDYRRINVALTRAKKALVLVGDEKALRTDPRYERMVEWAR